MNFLDFVSKNIWHVGPNIILAFIALVITIERSIALFLKFNHSSLPMFMNQITQAISRANVKDGISLCDTTPGSLHAIIIKEGLTRAHLPESNIQDGLTIGLQKATSLIQKRTGFLAMIANVSTLIGLVGTIAGLIHSFEAIGFADPQQKSTLLAAGISTSMNATLVGLGIAIPCLLFYSILSNRANRLIGELEQTAIQVLDSLKQRLYHSAALKEAKGE